MAKVAARLMLGLGFAGWALGQSSGGGAEMQVLRYERAIAVPAGSSGSVCAVLDAEVFAHAAGRALNDLRVFTADGREVPFTLTESEAQPEDGATAAVRNVRVERRVLLFDLGMPGRVSSGVVLDLAAQDFTGLATVTGESKDGVTHALGSAAIYDWSARGLGRSTEVALPEQDYPVLHVRLQLWGMNRGDAPPALSAAVIRSVRVPPSREAQTLYTTVAETRALTQESGRSVARMGLPAHVPVERVQIEMMPGFAEDFQREVEVGAQPEGTADEAAVERVSGDISTVHLPLYIDATPEAAIVRRMTVEATLAVNLRRAATVEVAIGSGVTPLPVRAVRLQMRQRRVCFVASERETYTLRYGDAEMAVPVYAMNSSGAAMSEIDKAPVMVALGREQVNAAFHPRAAVHERREWMWVGMFAAVAALGGWVRHRGGLRRGGHG